MCRTALRGCGRRCRRRLSGIWPARGAKAELRFWRALSAANRGTMTHDLFLLVVLLHFGAVIPPLCATREQREQGSLQEGDAGERRRRSRWSEIRSGSGPARQSVDIIEHSGAWKRQQRSPEATEQPATPATGWQALGFLGQNQGLERRNASNTAAMNCISLALSLASSLRSDPA